MARGDKNYDGEVRKVNKGNKSDEKIKKVHKMVEALIAGDSDAAAEALHGYLQEKTRDLLLGEKKEKPDFADIDKDGDEDESAKKAAKDKDKKDDDDDEDDDDKEDVKESAGGPTANLTKATKQKFSDESGKGKVHGNALKSKPHHSNDTKSKAGLEKHGNLGDTSSKGNSLKKKPHHSNDTKATKQKFKDESGKGKVKKVDDGRDYEMGTGNV